MSGNRASALLWDVRWTGYGFGKHGRGPFATKRQAEACLRAAGWPGTVEQVLCTMDESDLRRILAKGQRS